MCGSLESESAFREEANGDDKRTVCAVAKLNELRKFDEFYLSYKKGGSHSLLDSICPKKG